MRLGSEPARRRPGWTRPPGTIAATPVNAEERDEQDRDQHAPSGRPASSPSGDAMDPRLEREAPPDEQPGDDRAPGTSHSPNGTSRIAPRQATAATAGRISDSIGTPSRACDGWRLVGEDLERAEQHRPEQEDARPARRPGGSISRDSPTMRHRDERQVAPGRAVVRSRRWYAAIASHALRLAGDPGEQVRPRPRVDDVRRLDPRPARLADPPAHVVELARCCARPSRSTACSRPDRAAGALDGEVEALRRAVHLERRPGPGGLGVDRVPVEVEVVALADLPARRVGDDVDVRAADAVERPPRQLGPRLAARDVDRGDDEVEPRQQVVLVVERAVGADLELAAVEQPEALGRRLGRRRPGRLLGGVPGVERGDDLALLLDPVGRQAAGDRQRLACGRSGPGRRSRAAGRPRP